MEECQFSDRPDMETDAVSPCLSPLTNLDAIRELPLLSLFGAFVFPRVEVALRKALVQFLPKFEKKMRGSISPSERQRK